MSFATRSFRLLQFTILAALLGVAPLAAQGPPEPEGLRWSLGLGVISSPRPYVGADNQTRVIPILDLEYKRFYFRGVLAGYQVIESERFDLDVIGRAQFAGYEEKDSRFLAGMEERRETAELGLRAAWKLGRFALEATAVTDALGRHDGTEASLELTWSRIFDRGRAGLFPSVGVVWQDSSFVDYYAGVRPSEARPGRPAFSGESALNVGVGLRGFVQVTDRVRFLGLLRLERLANGFADSPIVDSDSAYFALVALAYEF